MNLKRGEKETGKIKEEREKKINEIKTYLCTNMKKEKKIKLKRRTVEKDCGARTGHSMSFI